MPADLSPLQAKYPSPTLNDLIAHPERYPAEVAQAQRTLDEWQRLITQPATSAILTLQQSLTRMVDEWQHTFAALANVQQTLTVVQQSLAPVLHQLRDYFRPGTFTGDLWLARDGDVAALARLAEGLPWAPSTKAPAWRVLAERGRDEGWEQVRRQALIVGPFEALKREDEPQRIKLGKQYLVNDDGSLLVRPTELPIGLYYDWLRKEAINAMEAHLLGEPYPPVRQRLLVVPLGEAMDVADELTPEDVVIRQELENEQRRVVEAILAEASPRTRQALIAALETPSNWADIAQRLGMAASTLRVLLHRERRRLERRKNIMLVGGNL